MSKLHTLFSNVILSVLFFAFGQLLLAQSNAYFRSGKKELAVVNLEKSLQLNPKNYDVRMRLKQIREN